MANSVHSKFRNSTGQAILLGVFGEASEANFRVVLQPGDIAEEDLFVGDRGFVIWDQFSDRIIAPILHFKVGDGGVGSSRFDLRLGAGGEVQIDAGSPAPGAPLNF
jgi:hypothetical protein